MTSDAEGARRFYGSLFGWTFETGGAESGFYSMCRVGGNDAAGLGPIPPNNPMPPAWTVYFSVRDANETCDRVKKAGGTILMDVMDVMDIGRMAICRDSTDAVFGIWQPLKRIGATVVGEHGAMAWSEVNSRDADRTQEFYRDVFDLDPRPLDDPSMKYFMLNQGEEAVAGVMQMTAQWGDIPPHWMPYFAVFNVDAAAEIVTSNGGQVVHGPFDTPYGRMAVIVDPQGAALSIIQLAAT